MMLFNSSLLLAQSNETDYVSILIAAAVVLAIIIIPFVIGAFAAKSLRMEDYGTKIGFILFTVTVAIATLVANWDREKGELDLNWGVDLRGGAYLVYQVVSGGSQATTEQDADGQDDKGDDTDDEEPKQTDAAEAQQQRVDLSALITALSTRLNPSGTSEISLRRFGDQQIEIVVPDADQQEIDRIKEVISTAGVLYFRIVADTSNAKHAKVIELARQQSKERGSERRLKEVKDDDGNIVGFWGRVPKTKEIDEIAKIRKFQTQITGDVIRDPRTGALLDWQVSGGQIVDEKGEPFSEANHVEDYFERLGVKEIDVLLVVDRSENKWVSGDDIRFTRAGFDESARPQIEFTMTGQGRKKMHAFTSANRPDAQGKKSRMAILFDEKVLSAPSLNGVISDRGRIEGDFTQEDVNFVVEILQSGKLSTQLQKEPISETTIDPLLGRDTIRKGQTAIGLSIILVLVFILIYYRFAGLIACMALVANLIFIVAIMVMLKATVSLAGLAGLVLTVGMSVDANVLIFERIREEMSRGAALRMAIRNGFAKATTTIVDANLTTLLTAFVLYGIGTDQVRGFAVTLILGILMSMFTAIFCSRVFFEIAERQRWMKQLNMMQALSATNINFLGKRYAAGVVSAVLIVIGLVAVFSRSTGMFDIDLSTGTSVVMQLEEPMQHEAVKKILSENLGETEDNEKVRFTLNNMKYENQDGKVWRVVTSLKNVDDVKGILRENFKLARYEMGFDEGTMKSKAITVPGFGGGTTNPALNDEGDPSEPPPTNSPEVDAPDSSVPEGDESDTTTPNLDSDDDSAAAKSTEDDAAESENDSQDTPPDNDDARNDLPNDSVLAFAGSELQVAQANDTDGDAAPASDDDAEVDPANPETEGDDVTGVGTEESAVESSSAQMSTTATVSFGNGIAARTLQYEVRKAAERLTKVRDITVDVYNEKWDQTSNEKFPEWEVTLEMDQEAAKAILNDLETHFNTEPIWHSANEIGSSVAEDAQRKAIMALLVSLLGIVGYIWIRFQRVIFGIAAVVALVHDILITLGAIAASAWVADYLGFLLIEEFKISLAVVAAFLTIVGYSLNDTIVVFDRIREVRGKNPNIDETMINTSINQTLSRTLLTSLTTFIVVIILYALGGEGIHAFAFALVIGVIVGTYSSIFVASPVLLWMVGVDQRPAKTTAKKSETASAS